jgi:hypothetical protein
VSKTDDALSLGEAVMELALAARELAQCQHELVDLSGHCKECGASKVPSSDGKTVWVRPRLLELLSSRIEAHQTTITVGLGSAWAKAQMLLEAFRLGRG